jgi:hypothetical protein
MSQGQTPDDIEDAMAEFVGRDQPLTWAARRSLHTLKVQAKEALDRWANVLDRPSMFAEDVVKEAKDDIIERQRALTEARTHWAIRVLGHVELAKAAELRFDASPLLAVNADRQKYLITHFSENNGFQGRPVHMEWYPSDKLLHGLNINTNAEMTSLVQQLRDRYATHVQALLQDRASRVRRKHGDSTDYTRVVRKHEMDSEVMSIKEVVSELTAALTHMNNDRHSQFTDSAQPVKKDIRGMGDRYVRNPAEEDITYDPKNRYMLEFKNPNTNAVVKVQSTTLRRHKPFIPYTENLTTTEFMNDKLLPHTLRWVLVTITTQKRSHAIKVMPFHGKSTSMVFPFIAKVTGEHADTQDMTDFAAFEYDVSPLAPFVIQGKPKEVDIMYQAIKVSRLVGYTGGDVRYDEMPDSLRGISEGHGSGEVFPQARAYYSVEDRKHGDTSVYLLMVRNQILGVQVYSPYVGKVLWKHSQAVGRAPQPQPGPWVTPPPGMPPAQPGASRYYFQPQIPPPPPARPPPPPTGVNPQNGLPPNPTPSVPHIYSPGYLKAHPDINRNTVPRRLKVWQHDDAESEVLYSITDVSDLIYVSMDKKRIIKPFWGYYGANLSGFSWGMFEPDNGNPEALVKVGELGYRNPNLITETETSKLWTIQMRNRAGEVESSDIELAIEPDGDPQSRRYNQPYPIPDAGGAKGEMPSYLPLQPRRLAARPGPAPWRDAGQPSVEMAGVLASLAEIKRALNEARALAPASR